MDWNLGDLTQSPGSWCRTDPVTESGNEMMQATGLQNNVTSLHCPGLKCFLSQSHMVVYAYNPSYLGGGDGEV
jgi:hypothetical protein